MRPNLIGGVLTIEQARSEYDLGTFVVKFGNVPKAEAERKPEELYTSMQELGRVVGDTRAKDVSLDISGVKKILEMGENEEMAIGVFAENEFGLLKEPIWKTVTDAFLPEKGPVSVKFFDKDGEPGKIGGDVVVEDPKEMDGSTEE